MTPTERIKACELESSASERKVDCLLALPDCNLNGGRRVFIMAVYCRNSAEKSIEIILTAIEKEFGGSVNPKLRAINEEEVNDMNLLFHQFKPILSYIVSYISRRDTPIYVIFY